MQHKFKDTTMTAIELNTLKGEIAKDIISIDDPKFLEGIMNIIHKFLSKKEEEDDDLSFLSQLSGAWDDGTTIEEKMKEIRGDYDANNQRDVEVW